SLLWPLALLLHHPPPCHSQGVSHLLLHPLPHSHPASWQGWGTTQPPMTPTSPGTALRPTNGLGTPAPLPLNTPAPGKPKSTTMEAILTTPTSPRATWTHNIAPPNSPMLPLPPRQSPPRAKGKERPRARTQPHLLMSQHPVLQPASLRGPHHCRQQSVASL